MKVFQSAHTFTAFNQYLENKHQISRKQYSFAQFRQILIDEGFNAVHQLMPVLEPTKELGFFTLWNYEPMQLQWAKEKGWDETDLKKILFAQIEEFGGDVFYNLSPIQYTSDEISQLPKKMVKIGWFASPEKNNIDFSVYNTRFTNLPSDVDQEGKKGFRSHFFQLSDSPVFHTQTQNKNRPIDLLFFGQYIESHFDKRNSYIDELIRLQEKHGFNLVLALMANYQYKFLLPFKLPMALHHKFKVLQFPSKKVAANSVPALFGAEMLRHIGQAKIVFNCHVDMAGDYRVNMRIFEALGCGAHMLSDSGIYPNGLYDGEHFSVYKDVADLEEKILYLLNNKCERERIANNGAATVRANYSKEQQWKCFQKIVGEVS
jgi:spore maturation protein CgeB